MNNPGPGSEDDSDQEMTREEMSDSQSLTIGDTAAEITKSQSGGAGVLGSISESIRMAIKRISGVIRNRTWSGAVARTAYIRAISEVDESLDRVITANDIERETEYNIAEIAETFGSWRAALHAADIDVRGQIRDEIARLDRELGHPPSPAEMNEHGHISATFVENTFESYDAAIAQEVQDTETTADGSVLSETAETVHSSVYAVATLAKRSRIFIKKTLKRCRHTVTTASVRVRQATSSNVLHRWSGHLSLESDSLRRRLPSPVQYRNRLRDVTPKVNRRRRDLLKYAGSSLTISVAVSSSDSLYGTDAGPDNYVAYGYGGIPVTTDVDPNREQQDDVVTPTPEATQSPSTEAVTPPTAVPTTGVEEPSTPRETESATESNTVTESTDTSEETTPAETESATESNTVTESTDTSEETTPAETESATESNTVTESTDSIEETATETEDDTNSEQSDRYRSDFDVPQQGYGEGGYGGVATG